MDCAIEEQETGDESFQSYADINSQYYETE